MSNGSSPSTHPDTASYVASGNAVRAEVDAAALEKSAHPCLARSPDADCLRAMPDWEEVAGLMLSSKAAASWKSLVGREPLLDLSGYEWERSSWRDGACDWKIFMEIYFDDYHVDPFHPGLCSLADCGALRWLWEDQAQAQWVGASAASGSGSASHAELYRLSEKIFGELGASAVWAAIYPSTMVEWLAGGLAISVIQDQGQGSCANRTSFCYPKGVAEKHPDFVAAHQAAYWETALEDDEIAKRIQGGRSALAARGEHEEGPMHPHLEAGIERFHRWISGLPCGEDLGGAAMGPVAEPRA